MIEFYVNCSRHQFLYFYLIKNKKQSPDHYYLLHVVKLFHKKKCFKTLLIKKKKETLFQQTKNMNFMKYSIKTSVFQKLNS